MKKSKNYTLFLAILWLVYFISLKSSCIEVLEVEYYYVAMLLITAVTIVCSLVMLFVNWIDNKNTDKKGEKVEETL